MKATIWTKKGCWRCDAEKKRLAAEGFDLEERDADEIESARDAGLRAELAMQNDRLPLVKINGNFVMVEEDW